MTTATAPAAAAPAAAAIEAARYALLPLDSIIPSDTPMQKRRRQSFSKESLQELAASIKSSGVLQPILVRPGAEGGNRVPGTYDLVAGERRLLAAKIAGLDRIPATIRELSDLQVIEMQIIENDQRKDLHELIEAEGYDLLRKPPHSLKPEDIAERVGRSRRYVFNRLKLCELCPEAANAFYDGHITGSVAFHIARIANHDSQRAALKDLKPRDGEPVPVREARDHIQRNYMLQLSKAPFDVKDAGLCPKAGACGPCPKRTGNQKELFDDVKSADVCTDPRCYAAKVDAHNQRRIDAARERGQTVIAGAEAKKLFKWDHQRKPEGMVVPDEQTWTGNKLQTYREILGKDAPPTTLVLHPKTHDLVEAWPDQVVRKLIAAKRPKQTKPAAKGKPGAPALSAEAIARGNAALFKLIRAKQNGLLTRAALLQMIKPVFYNVDTETEKLFAEAWKIEAQGQTQKLLDAIQKMPDRHLPAALIDLLILEAVEGGLTNEDLIAWCKPLRIDPAKVHKEAAAEPKKEAPAAKPAKTKAKKKAVAKK